MSKRSSKISPPPLQKGIAEEYLHGYSAKEQARLYYQAKFLERKVYRRVDLSKTRHLLEVGMGVGAQSRLILDRYPHLKVTGVEIAETQVQAAQSFLSKDIKSRRMRIQQADALNLPFEDHSFDGAFFCWFLEHVQTPVDILKETRRTLKPGSPIYISEVLNSSLFLEPYSPACIQYWFAFNDFQWNRKGDPFVGAKLGNLLLEAGYKNTRTWARVHHYDERKPKLRARFLQYWANLMLSGAPALVAAKAVSPALVTAMKEELRTIECDPNSVFFYSWIQARAEA